jgi:hypothetical protein
MQPGRAELDAHPHELKFLALIQRPEILAAPFARAALTVLIPRVAAATEEAAPKVSLRCEGATSSSSSIFNNAWGPHRGHKKLPAIARGGAYWADPINARRWADRVRDASRCGTRAASQSPTNVFAVAGKAARAWPARPCRAPLAVESVMAPLAARNPRRSEGTSADIAVARDLGEVSFSPLSEYYGWATIASEICLGLSRVVGESPAIVSGAKR